METYLYKPIHPFFVEDRWHTHDELPQGVDAYSDDFGGAAICIEEVGGWVGGWVDEEEED